MPHDETFTDDFNRPDSSTVGNGWTELESQIDLCFISNNTLRTNSTGPTGHSNSIVKRTHPKLTAPYNWGIPEVYSIEIDSVVMYLVAPDDTNVSLIGFTFPTYNGYQPRICCVFRYLPASQMRVELWVMYYNGTSFVTYKEGQSAVLTLPLFPTPLTRIRFEMRRIFNPPTNQILWQLHAELVSPSSSVQITQFLVHTDPFPIYSEPVDSCIGNGIVAAGDYVDYYATSIGGYSAFGTSPVILETEYPDLLLRLFKEKTELISKEVI